MTAWGAFVFPITCMVVSVGAVFYGADAWVHLTTMAMAVLCWITRRVAYDGIVRLLCAVGLLGGMFVLVVNAILSATSGMVEVAVMSFGCATLSGIAASTQMKQAKRFISDTVGSIKNRTV